ncbi:MAG: DUF962 domain-containing protein [Steroidobacteraceae bacterium]
MRSAAEWLDEYGASHHHPSNKLLHWICVPVIVWCVIGLLWSLPLPRGLGALIPGANWASQAVLAALVYYALLSVPLALGAAPILFGMLWSVDRLGSSRLTVPLWSVCTALFVLAWIGQFIGHAIGGCWPMCTGGWVFPFRLYAVRHSYRAASRNTWACSSAVRARDVA